MERFYLTTAIDYVNGTPHIGHAYEKIVSDVIVRHYKQRCNDVYFLTGTDEHGIKIQKTAAERGITPKQMCDEHAAAFKDAWKKLDIDYNQFIRTTDDYHEKAVQKIFEKLLAQGDIYKHSYTGLYCSGCEVFLNPKDLDENGCCPIHNRKPEEISEENYFFKLSKYKDAIIKHIKENPDYIMPAFRANEVLNQLENIEDISVSRTKDNVSWGIPVLSDDNQVIYVWIDALSNYITALGYDVDNCPEKFEKYWAESHHVIGKDILKFHSIYWSAILLALGLPLPKQLFVHGFININKEKMSKSLGNVISPQSVMEAWQLEEPDAFRYYMATAAPIGKDGNFSDEDFKEKVNVDLANNMGNLLNRTLSMLVKYFDGEVKPEFKGNNPIDALNVIDKVEEHFDKFELQEAAAEIVTLLDSTNKYVTNNAPWTLAKEEKMTECGQVLVNVLETLCIVSALIQPYCPNLADKMAQQLKFDLSVKLDDLTDDNIKVGKLISKEEIKPVFLRLDSEFATNKK
ncbi:methionine--tRNA ligase [bacterium]|nr:methionine--tRNA ligase [bacterium]